MCAAFAECLLTVAPLMANTLVMTVQWCGEFAAMRFICSALQSGCQPKPSSDVHFADDHGNSSLQQQTQQPHRQLASHAQHSVRTSAPVSHVQHSVRMSALALQIAVGKSGLSLHKFVRQAATS